MSARLLDNHEAQTMELFYSEVFHKDFAVKKTVLVPDLQSIKEAEARYWKAHQIQEEFVKKEYALSYQALQKVGAAHSCDDGSWYFHIGYDGGTSRKSSRRPQKPLHLEIGNRFSKASKRLSSLNQRKTLFEEVFLRVLWSFLILDENKPQNHGDILHLVINGRNHWECAKLNRYGVLVWTFICQESSKVRLIEI